ncbi:roadblock/LC7 domain-containing protein [Streptomyces sp. WAC06614]|uniref:roadblock/LC7 domain-containing protein n=1 Tax=Streptomyces sp. WAC06614 TaxID=2487416 RepID=UPI000F76A17B|nr:roadblock/LC7 domain-containing protein [Streptomyces sp. WAC06614]RSS75502.1 roadblock/LC7 domain-containing protein [Streptomyces sp. WAC06614]
MTDPTAPGHGELDWLVARFAEENPYVEQAAVVSSDGVLLAHSARGDAARAEHLAALTCGITALALSCAEVAQGGGVRRTLVDLHRGCLLLYSLSEGALLAVHAADGCDLALLGYQSTRLARRAGAALTPAPRGGAHGRPAPAHPVPARPVPGALAWDPR